MASVKNIGVADLFCGVGGLTNGFRSAGLTVKVGLDNDPTCQHAFERNNASRFISADISKFDFSELKDHYKSESFFVLAGCAPCQVFSSHSFKIKGKEEDKRWVLLNHFTRGINKLSPDIVSMENVRGIVKTDVFRLFIKSLKAKGYYIDYKIVSSADYGISQRRARLVLLASKLGEIKIPPPTHTKDAYVTVREIIGELPKIQAGERSKNDFLHRAKKLADINLKRIEQSTPGGNMERLGYAFAS